MRRPCMAWLNRANLQTLFLDAAGLAARKLVRHDCGELHVTSGRLVACDPGTQPDRLPFTRIVPGRGRFPVQVIAEGNTPALAAILFRPRPQIDADAVRWEMATVEGQAIETLAADQFFGFPVDTGTGCYMDADAAAAIGPRVAELDDFIRELLDDAEASYGVFRPDGENGVDCAVFRAGFGDGSYPSYWALDRFGSIVALATDFMTLEDGDARTPRERARDAYRASLSPMEIEVLEALAGAVERNDAAAVSRLIADGRAANAINPSSGETAIAQAIRTDRTAMLRLLLGAPARCPAMPEQMRIAQFSTYLDYALFLRTPRDPAMIALLREATPA